MTKCSLSYDLDGSIYVIARVVCSYVPCIHRWPCSNVSVDANIITPKVSKQFSNLLLFFPFTFLAYYVCVSSICFSARFLPTTVRFPVSFVRCLWISCKLTRVLKWFVFFSFSSKIDYFASNTESNNSNGNLT